MEIIKINNLNDITALLFKINQGEDIDVELLDLTALNEIKIKAFGEGEQFSGKLTSSICYGLRDFHNELLKTYCIIRYNTDNLRHLKDTDKEALEIVFSIEPGCTQILADLKDFIVSCGEAFSKATNGMTGNQKAACYIFTALCVTGYFTFDNYSERHSTEVIAEKENAKEIELQKNQLEQMKEVRKGILQALSVNNKQPLIMPEIETKTSKAYEHVIKPFATADKIEIQGVQNVELNNKEINEFLANPTPKIQSEDAKKVLEIDSIKRTLEKLTVICREKGSEDSFALYTQLT
ncbi:conserved hypothetical protein [Xenorhabdus bovienii str. oregonense]|uniref:Uncharacterized protein n=1 Tax=Xenorhabdus bovienii str. oregonense TaxID=1398202 RepID=A0A077NZF2_XENBV|nr:hypothetical protein [Xenorhabdus bovienii]CDH07617.1 conserved hypothetical protein [Xenorhabdus bovienii str. oregonense]